MGIVVYRLFKHFLISISLVRNFYLDDPYVVLYRILSNHFTKEDVNTMRRSLCQSSFEVSSWQEAPSNHDRLASAYSFVFKRRG